MTEFKNVKEKNLNNNKKSTIPRHTVYCQQFVTATLLVHWCAPNSAPFVKDISAGAVLARTKAKIQKFSNYSFV